MSKKAEGGTGAKFKEAHALVVEVGLSVTKACKRVGLSRATYYLYLNEKPAVQQHERANGSTLSGTVGLPTHVTREPGVSGADDRQESA